ncbi:discoidin domain-containing protein [Pirellulales bacterium]|nr:discoidin domain-containing protein [Pirellulales bacterium]
MKYSLWIVAMIFVFFAAGAVGEESSPTKMRNLALGAKVTASSTLNERAAAELAVDGDVKTRWISGSDVLSTLDIDLGETARIGGVHIYSGAADTAPIENALIQYWEDNQWKNIPSGRIQGNSVTATWVKFQDSDKIITDKLRLLIAKTHGDIARIKEITVWPYLDEGIPQLGMGVKSFVRPIDQSDVPPIYVNQSGYNLHRPKSFTAPEMSDGTRFVVREKKGKSPLFEGEINGHRGDFSEFNPTGKKEYVVEADGHTSFPFRIGPYWLERVTYQNAVDFMIDSRHYVGTSRTPIGNSIGWRDDCHYAFEVNTLVAQYLSNPAAYERMPVQIKYERAPKPDKPNQSRAWGALAPYPADAPDIVKLIHWGADVIVTQGLTHELLKEQMAYFLYAWPWLKPWLPEQNYEVVRDYAFTHWGDSEADRRYAWDKSPEHNLFAVKTVLGTTKGELPPGHSVQPNLLMYEVAKREGRDDAEKYFDAASAQTEWMIENLDWNDPQTTKGQRMSEHVTMTGLAHFAAEYPDRAPAGLKQKIVNWAEVMVRRSDNMWDFRRLTDGSDWVPSGKEPTMWNEPGNVAGTPACMAAAISVIDDPELKNRLRQLVYSHIDNVFGRNPTGRHFSYDAPKEIEGVEIGWYSEYGTGVGMLGEARFVLEASPKREHYPFNPSVGNIGWSEGWVNHNTAFNASLAAMAHLDTEVRLAQSGDKIKVHLLAPLNFDYRKPEPVTLHVTASSGDAEDVVLKEASSYAEEFVGSLPTARGDPQPGDGILQIEEDGHVESSYGYGYLSRHGRVEFGRMKRTEFSRDEPQTKSSPQTQIPNLAMGKRATASSALRGRPARHAVDGDWSTRWISQSSDSATLEIDLGQKELLCGVHLYFDHGDTSAIEDFNFSYSADGTWQDVPIYHMQSARVDLGCGKLAGNARSAMWFKLKTIETDKLRILSTKTEPDSTMIRQVMIWPYLKEAVGGGFPGLGHDVPGGWDSITSLDDIPRIYLNQSGFNLNRPKRFTAPTLADGTPFTVRQTDGEEALHTGEINGQIGDFSEFNPTGNGEYIVEAGGETSVPFGIGPYWLERVTYQNAIDFMIDSRHYVGTSTKPIGNSIGWRDDCHFAFEVNTLVAQYLSNPVAYQRMPRHVHYRQPPKPGLWGALEPYSEDAPDIVKMIHWGADVIVSQGRTHEMLKEQLAYFLYAWPWLKKWLPEQNHDMVSKFAFAHWGDSTADRKYQYDKSPEHDLFAIKKALGTTKGELPPGHSVQANLLMYEVAKREGRDDAEEYFDAAYAQTEWMIAHLDWNDPQTTKGQRMSEHVTLTGLAHFLAQYPDRAPAGLQKKIVDWANVMIRRSDNMWDFRRLTDDGDWTPSGSQPTMWNEPGNVAGFPACLLAAIEVIDDPQINDRLEQLVYAHLDNVFGRNPTGRHFSFNAPREIEGVEIGWYSEYGTGVGTLQNTRFILEAAPKRQHYPYHPEVGNIGWSEGWVNFNTAFNVSLAYMAHNDTEIELTRLEDKINIRLHAPLNFDYGKEEKIAIWIVSSSGDKEKVTLKEKSPYSQDHSGTIPVVTGDKKAGDGKLQVEKNARIETSYGFGYMAKTAELKF